MTRYELRWTSRSPEPVTFEEAKTFPTKDYRLPTSNELTELMDMELKGKLGKDFGPTTCWVSDPESFYVRNGRPHHFNLDGVCHVRLVRERWVRE